MAIHPSKLGRISVAKQSAWGTKQTSFAAATYAECEVALPQLVREALSIDAFKGSFHSNRIVAGSRDGATISLRMPLHGWSASTPSADPTSSDQTVESVLLEYAMGGVYYGDIMSRTVDSSTTSKITASGAFGSGEVGMAVLCDTAAAGASRAVGWIKSRSGAGNDEMNLATVLPAVGHATGALYGSITHFVSNTQPSVGLSLEYLGADDTSRIILFDGCVTRLKILAAPKAQPVMEVDLHFADFELMASGGNPGQYTFALPQLPAAIGNNGTRMMIAGSDVPALNAEIEITCEYKGVPNHSSSEGISQFVITDRVVSMAIEAPASTINDANVYAPGTELSMIQLDLNPNVAGSACSIMVPAAIVTDQSTLGDAEGIVSVTHAMAPGYYDGDNTGGSITSGSGSTTPADTVARIALL